MINLFGTNDKGVKSINFGNLGFWRACGINFLNKNSEVNAAQAKSAFDRVNDEIYKGDIVRGYKVNANHPPYYYVYWLKDWLTKSKYRFFVGQFWCPFHICPYYGYKDKQGLAKHMRENDILAISMDGQSGLYKKAVDQYQSGNIKVIITEGSEHKNKIPPVAPSGYGKFLYQDIKFYTIAGRVNKDKITLEFNIFIYLRSAERDKHCWATDEMVPTDRWSKEKCCKIVGERFCCTQFQYDEAIRAEGPTVHTDQASCQSAGFYWYDSACHSEKKEEDKITQFSYAKMLVPGGIAMAVIALILFTTMPKDKKGKKKSKKK